MERKEYLNEEKTQKTNKTLFFMGIIIILLGIIAAMIMIVPKIINSSKTNTAQLQQKLNQLKPALEKRYAELQANGVNESWDYKDKDGYEMFLIDEALDPTYNTCESSSKYSDNDTTRDYCKIKAQIYNSNSSFSNRGIMFTIVPALMILMPCLAFGAMFILTAKRREILAYNAQQVMPIAQEGIEKMAPTIGKAGASIAKEMTPVYGEIAKEIGKGIKEGLKDQDNEKE